MLTVKEKENIHFKSKRLSGSLCRPGRLSVATCVFVLILLLLSLSLPLCPSWVELISGSLPLAHAPVCNHTPEPRYLAVVWLLLRWLLSITPCWTVTVSKIPASFDLLSSL